MYSEEELAILWFCSFDKISNKKFGLLFDMADSVKELKDNLIEYKQDIISIVGQEIYVQMKLSNTDKFIDKLLTDLTKQNAGFITYKSKEYPDSLLEIEDYPYILYYKGNIDIIADKCIAVVGTRRPTRYGVLTTKQFTKSFVDTGLTVVSGGARGIDSIAISEAIENNGKVIIVLGSGIDVVYPPENKNLFKMVENGGGLILTEYPLKTPPNSYNFPYRNRIVSGLSDGVLVTEAGEKSGTMITVDYALNQGKEVFLVPGNINSLTSSGTNNMLKSGYGNMVTEPNDILNHYKLSSVINDSKELQLDYNQSAIMELIRQNGEAHFEQLLNVVDVDMNELNNILFEMQLNGLITKLPGNYYGV